MTHAQAVSFDHDSEAMDPSALPRPARVRVLLAASDADLLRSAHERLDGEPDLEIVGTVVGLDQVCAARRRTRPDVLVVDVTSPPGRPTTDVVLRAWAADGTNVLVLAEMSGGVREAMIAGARGYLLKDDGPDLLPRAVRAVASGRRFLSPGVATALLAAELVSRRAPHDEVLAKLTPRERQVLQLIAEGKTTREIARILALTLETVRTHRKRLMRKLGVRNTVGIVRFAVVAGVIR